MSFSDSISRVAATAGLPRLRWPEARPAYIGITLLLTALLTASFALSIRDWTVMSYIALPLAALSGAWISGGAATALIGLAQSRARPVPPPAGWVPEGQTAILITLCKEDPSPVAWYIADLSASLGHAGLDCRTRIFVLSDTPAGELAEREATALADLHGDGRIQYRRRAENTGRKPGNIADWLHHYGDAFDYMLVMDADSRMSASRIRRMIRQMEMRPRTGLLQAGMALIPGQSRFGKHQRTAVRLMSHNFGRGMAAWAGRSSNYWGHNAILRVAAFREAAHLPVLPGKAPFGGPVLSHDFIEAAWIRRAGWAVELDPDMAGSAEDGPQTLDEFHKRDRRWCQGNMQHIGMLATPGLHPISRLHLASGALSYLAAPIWLVLVVLIASGAVPVAGAIPFALVAAVLLAPKICALAGWLRSAGTLRRRLVILRASLGELILSTVIAPIMMLRQTASVGSILLGRDCGWKSNTAARLRLPRGMPEAAAGAALLALALQTDGGATLWLAPLILPLLAAPLILRALDAQPV
ncbi:membrane glycosyltransferase [Roseovarius nanhaiticus]|uniref:Glucans biosynthesis glucosyltransferase H n=1 Tax=Roseovarius nanhaiticus TaxID=573024 RepID=A0A1N7G178_9RHOB|nr:glucans biosynthesis glucosyltransferase MdoH [Roseovarius nanhaiticus]SEK39928.1 membrane glycosyltransferase [Roseovarius nanhaiticus]SIS06349.1 membrane glycosyltransferase [Roseovarius nanhaiticus]